LGDENVSHAHLSVILDDLVVVTVVVVADKRYVQVGFRIIITSSCFICAMLATYIHELLDVYTVPGFTSLLRTAFAMALL